MSRHRAQARKGRLRRWLNLSRATLHAPQPPAPTRPELRLLTPHLDSAPAEPEASTPFDGRHREPAAQEPPRTEPWTPAAAQAPAEPEVPQAVLEAVGAAAKAYAEPFNTAGQDTRR